MAAIPAIYPHLHQINAEAQTIYDLRPEERYETAQQYFNEGFYAAAMQLYQNYPANGPNYFLSLSQAARCLYLLGEHENALRHFQQIDQRICEGLNFDLAFTGLREMIGIGHFLTYEREGAIDPRFVGIPIDVINHLLYFGDAYAQLDFYKAARTQYRKALWLSQRKQLEDMYFLCGILIAKMNIKLHKPVTAKAYFGGADNYCDETKEPFQDHRQKIQFLNAYDWCVTQLGQHKDLHALYQNIPNDHPSVIYHLRRLAFTYGNRNQKIERLEKILQLAQRFFLHPHPYIARIHRDLGKMYSDLTEGDQRREHYRIASAAFQHQIHHFQGIDQRIAYYQLGKLEQIFGRNLSAFACYERALALENAPLTDPIYGKITTARNTLQHRVQQHLARIHQLRLRNLVEPLNELVELLCRHLEREDESFDRLSALTEGENFQQHPPEMQARCLRNLGCIRSNQERHEEAVAYFLRAREFFAQCIPIHQYDVLYRLATSLARLNRHIEAIEQYALTIETYFEANQGQFNWGHLPGEDALVRLERSLDLVQTVPPTLEELVQNPEHVNQMTRAGWCLFRRNHYEQARICFRNALDWSVILARPDEDNFDILFGLANCYLEQGNFFRALNYFNLILDVELLEPRHREIVGIVNRTLQDLLRLEMEEPQDIDIIWILTNTMTHLVRFEHTPRLPDHLAPQVCASLIERGLRQADLPRGHSLIQAFRMGNEPLLMQEIVYHAQLCNLVWASENDHLRESLRRAQSDNAQGDPEQFMHSGRAYVEELINHLQRNQ